MKDHLGRPLVAVTGIGIVTPLAWGREANWQAVQAGRSGISRIRRFPVDKLRTTIAGTVELPEEAAGGEIVSSPVRVERMAAAAVEEALAQAALGEPGAFPGPLMVGMPPVEYEWPQRFELARKAKGDGSYRAATEAATGRRDLYETFLFGGVGERLAARFGTTGAPIALTTACATGASAIQMAVEAIQRGESDAAIALGADGSVQPEAVIRFSLLSALTARNEEPEKASRPFEKTRDGFVMSEGAAALVLESLEHARRRGATVLGIVSGCGERADSFHRTRSNPDGSAIIGAMRNAIADAGLQSSDIGYVNAHGTGTPENDKMETLGMRAVFGDAPPPISSNKSMIGHTLSAAGAIEAALSLLTIRDQVLPPTINHNEPDPAITLDVVPNVARKVSGLKHVLSNSFGFGGQNVCLVVSAAP
ncbi:beta-ketoacyl-ACP synthase [Roseomonas alkaliterrae]|uniref:3-oxoacyl-[acyl-carrier-protein] synthase II n=1 Tax=Neoroseomonas alkaliterrae TaxID=1452450 RepID=A0A840XW31_9PROT|nr:beta-ketoacyl synthase N-terminal-like domain-containing protein [Neoroseomonas alkaliterrae]MBB5690839.1 3-oxoacyl-[acyl-carrier-protein] synthase II [Neoroseomonas alkaliterrae]MBR0677817.1 beta-ketoacyl-ACP synthase [Neoroseomonas alkaliterrae]